VGWVVIGTCNHCGACCGPPEVVDNPCKPITEPVCLFFDEDEPGDGRFGHCMVLATPQRKNARDRYGNKITDAQLAWFQENCPQYPMDCLEEWRTGTWEPPETCSFELQWVEDLYFERLRPIRWMRLANGHIIVTWVGD